MQHLISAENDVNEVVRRADTHKASSLTSRETLLGIGQLMELNFRATISDSVKVVSVLAELRQLAQATTEIQKKAASIAGLAGGSMGDVEFVPGGFRGRYAGCDIYYSVATGAHEVHGEIKAKYDALGGPASKLGLPVTDELGVGDPAGGRFNDFVLGSIYWTPHTGPMMMLSAIRDFWRTHGAQNGFGYPVYDQHQQVLFTPATDPHVAWCGFENGAVVQTPDGVAAALAAVMSPPALRTMVRSKMDVAFHQSPDNVGLHPAVETVSVGGWRHGMWASQPRTVTFRLHGFRDNGLILPDTNFDVVISLSFDLVWQPLFTEATTKTLVANLEFLRVIYESGLDQFVPTLPGQVVSGVAAGVYKAFYPDTWPDPSHPEVPNGSIFIADVLVLRNVKQPEDVIDILTTADGGLQVLVNPLPSTPVNVGLIRLNAAQSAIDSLNS